MKWNYTWLWLSLLFVAVCFGTVGYLRGWRQCERSPAYRDGRAAVRREMIANGWHPMSVFNGMGEIMVPPAPPKGGIRR